MVKRHPVIVTALFLFLMSAPFLGADITTTVKITSYSVLYRLADESFSLASFSLANMDFKSKGVSNVKGELEVNSLVSDRLVLDVSRAYLKVRFPWFDLTAGKSRLSWGEGFAFNAGDVLFESMSPVLDLSGSVLHDQTAPLAAVTSHFGNFTFLELVGLPGTFTTEFPPGSGLFIPTGIDVTTLSGGGRFSTRIADLFCEAGYLYRGGAKSHNPYLSFHGVLFDFIDFYLAGTCSIAQDNPEAEAIKESVKASFGLFKSFDLGVEQSFTFRVEAALYPFAAWEEPESPSPATEYALYLFPEIALALPEKVGIQLRSLISPVAGCGVILGGVTWNPIQGFNAGLLLSCMFGDNSDLYGWGRERDLALILNLEYLFGG